MKTAMTSMNVAPRPRVRPGMSRLLGAAAFALAISLAAAPVAHALEVGERAVEFTLTDLNGKAVKLSSLRGKVVLIDFWATWCKPCKEELPLLEKLHQKLKGKGLVILAININKKKEDATRFASANKLTMTVPFDGSSDIVSKYKPPKMPSSYLVDKKGIVRKLNAGFYGKSDLDKLEKIILDLLAKP